jgi:hypothetical protein
MLDRQLGGPFIGMLLGCLGGVAILAMALERRISPRVNGLFDEEPSRAATTRATGGPPAVT